MAGFAATPVIYGPLSDHFGRRPILAVATALAFALVRDCFEGATGRAKLSHMQMVMGVAPMIAASFARFGVAAMVLPMLGFGLLTNALYFLMVRPALSRA